ncbi:hypothetical protein Z517_11952 [Fonsecaea pedrosoi CBS 271.37]|uniref:Uncharacterized protein n=1 Tax=Fonsecaea pedrosoi CBS 271.37 TaxID=1442368 RepID=A0A0D2G8Q6_9EURO|nr:uncharacterized protein Z517_11952 [Fonsecaea pedrosoi CBS 271.37]KIW75180.1 hypothetical protein Z517_11952 [Fonsecaea pedrosoi CBS 271.37]
MGQTQSQESESASPPRSEPDDQFDISQIPDDRDQASNHNSDAGTDRTPAHAPDESSGMANRLDRNRRHKDQSLAVKKDANASRRKSKNRHRKRRLSSNNASDDAVGGVPKRTSPPLVNQVKDTSPNTRPLKDTEPETYHIYATSDTSDAEDTESKRRGGFNAFATLNGASQKSTPAVSNTGFDNSHDRQRALEKEENQHISYTPEIDVATGTKAPDGETLGPPTMRVTQLEMNGEGRFLCPSAEVHNCRLTFGSAKAATRHANIHTTSFRCVVCGKQMSRKDTLARHMKQHSAFQIASAEAASNPNEDSEAEMPELPQAMQPNTLHDVHDRIEDGEPPEEDSIVFATPQERPEAKNLGHNLDVELQPEEHDKLEVEMAEAAPDADVVEVVSDQRSSSPSSVFDEAEDFIVKETPMPKGILKRKRDAGDGAQPQRPSPERTRKRRKGSPNSPPTSVPPNDTTKPDSVKKPEDTDALQNRQITDKIVPRLQKRQGSMDGWAQKYTPGSGLRHPTLNPKSPPSRSVTEHVEVIIPQTSQAGPSSAKSKKNANVLPNRAKSADLGRSEVDSFPGPSQRKKKKAPYATPKGKTRADPDVDYSTPVKDSAHGEVNGPNSDGDSEPVEIATSVAKRTFPAPRQQKKGQKGHDNSDSDADQSSNSDVDVSKAASAKKTSKVTQAPRPKQSDNGDRLECARCHRRFISRDLLNRHLKKQSVHVGLHKCQECSEEFWASTALAAHEKDMGHGRGNGLQGRTGAFSQTEVEKLNRWRDAFCDYHNITRIQFNDMMTDTLTRDKGNIWRWPFIKRAEFLKEYRNVLPNRNKRSMLRYRERNFQNVEGSRNWTEEDDKDLIRLHKELGPKWAEIAKRLTRTVDAVSQRWWHKLRYGDVDTGEWSKAEDAKFWKILDELRLDSDGNEPKHHRIPWNKVSEKMGTRSAQQCSNHYRARHSKKERGRWIKIDAPEKNPGLRRILTPSKMELRLRGLTTRRTPKKGLSEEYVRDDDEDDDEASADVQEDGKTSEKDKSAENTSEEDAGTGHGSEPESDVEAENQSLSSADDDGVPRTRGPVIAKTPGKVLGSSQLFEQTQANTSALKPSQTSSRKTRLPESQDRPSPNVPIQRRRLESRSPLTEIPVFENGDLDLGEEDEGNESGSDVSDGENSNDLGVTQELDEELETSDSSADGDEDAVDAEAAEAEANEEDDDNDDDTAETDEDMDGEDGNDTHDNVDEASSQEDEEDEDSEAPAKNKSSFMDSINESVKRSRMRSSQSWTGVPVPGTGLRGGRKLRKGHQADSDEE